MKKSLAIILTGGNRNDVTQLLPLVDGVGPVRGKGGRPRLRPDKLIADRGYDHDKWRFEGLSGRHRSGSSAGTPDRGGASDTRRCRASRRRPDRSVSRRAGAGAI